MTSPSGQRRQLELERPLAFIDIDSTGLDPYRARAVRLSVLKLMPGGEEHARSVLINPGVPIPPGATQVHGIKDDDVAQCPPFKAYARALADHLEGCDLAGFGIERFDLPLLVSEFDRAGVEFSLKGRAVVDAMVIFHRLEPRDLAAAHRRYAGRDLPARQQPGAAARAAMDVLRGQLGAEPALPGSPAALADWMRDSEEDPIDPDARFVWSSDGDALVNFGRYRGERLGDVAEQDPGYLGWVTRSSRFGADARQIAENAVKGYLPTSAGQ